MNLDDVPPLTSHQRPQNGSAAVSFYTTELSTRQCTWSVDHTNLGVELKVQRKAKLVGHGNRGAEAGSPGVWAYRGVVPVEAV